LGELYESYINQDEFLYYANKEKIDIDELRGMLILIEENYLKYNYYNWLIVRKIDNTILGSINLKEKEESVLSINYAIDNRYTYNGYMSEALDLIKNYCFRELKAIKLVGACCVENIASKRVMEKCGFINKGIIKNYICLKDGLHDAYEFYIE
jgi:RimJ/RimL family protein N-acetyltransferase